MNNISNRQNYIEKKSVFLSVFQENSITPSFDNWTSAFGLSSNSSMANSQIDYSN